MAKIMIVDDSESLRKQLKGELESLNHQVSEAFDGVNAIEVLRQGQQFDLIFLDMNMPGLNGLQVLKQISEEKLVDGTAIFMLTTETSIDIKKQAKELGVRAWVTKPYDFPSLAKAISRITGDQ